MQLDDVNYRRVLVSRVNSVFPTLCSLRTKIAYLLLSVPVWQSSDDDYVCCLDQAPRCPGNSTYVGLVVSALLDVSAWSNLMATKHGLCKNISARVNSGAALTVKFLT